jgi:hypothetical protein
VLERGLHRERGHVGLGEIAGHRAGIDALCLELFHSLRHGDRVAVRRDQHGARAPEGLGDGVTDLAGPAYAGDQDDFAGKNRMCMA